MIIRFTFSILLLLLFHLLLFTPVCGFYNYILPVCQFINLVYPHEDVQRPHQENCKRWEYSRYFTLYRRGALEELNPYWLSYAVAGKLDSRSRSVKISIDTLPRKLTNRVRVGVEWSFLYKQEQQPQPQEQQQQHQHQQQHQQEQPQQQQHQHQHQHQQQQQEQQPQQQQEHRPVPEDYAKVSLVHNDQQIGVMVLCRETLVEGEPWQRVHYSWAIVSLPDEFLDKCQLKIKTVSSRGSGEFLIGNVKVEAIGEVRPNDLWLQNGKFTIPTFEGYNQTFKDTLPYWIGSYVAILNLHYHDPRINLHEHNHVCELSVNEGEYIEQTFAVVTGLYRVTVFWEEVIIEPHEHQTVQVLVANKPDFTIVVNEDVIRERRRELEGESMTEEAIRMFKKDIVRTLSSEELSIGVYILHTIRLVTVESSGRSLIRIVEVRVASEIPMRHTRMELRPDAIARTSSAGPFMLNDGGLATASGGRP